MVNFKLNNKITLIVISILLISACGNQHQNTEKASSEKTPIVQVSYEQKKFRFPIRDVSVCRPSNMSRSDSATFMEGGGRDYHKTIFIKTTEHGAAPAGMVLVGGGEFSMGGVNPIGMAGGGHEMMNDARPVHRVGLHTFYMDVTDVTNKQFAEFVKATGYVTVAEQKPTHEEFPDAPEENLVAGSVVFTAPKTKVQLNDYSQWWDYVKGANWRHPLGPKSTIVGKDNYPVVQVCWQDAAAYAKWAGKRLPSEAEWEFAARGTLSGNLYAWGNELKPKGKWMANIFEGSFPYKDTGLDGYAGIAPVKQFPANGYGLYDMAGNVWQWCNDWYRADYYGTIANNNVTNNPAGPADANDPDEPGVKKKVQRGGSFLCTDEYCTRYMVGTRGKGDYRSASNHLGFRCVADVK